ncbi:GNAT family N-acetyltransferase [Paenibacillus campinasensis]|uniref:GNAT family N-acetyltransferase n=1 Tax=Paenibacillus campinasensis TaxID=66347 RepID=A0A268ENJ5_9BACL|nr:GNAT family N-acetyltransferase [Paenibacillus campinasensis]PAD74696.1 GNAT family N-acetyltransferase [Paenibacillus campinasensis]
MEEYILIEPSYDYKDEYIDMIEEWKATGEKMTPFVLRFDYSDFDKFLYEIMNLKTSKNLGTNRANSSTYWLTNTNKRIIGAVNIRHQLTQELLHIGGHIGFGIRPSERLKGHATRILSLALIKANELGINKALVTCDKDNIGSAKTIINNGGSLDSEDEINGVAIQRYWIKIK